jgi:hypothetical protein
VLFAVGAVLTATGIAWSIWPSQAADRSFNPQVVVPAYSGSPRPEVVIDEAHANVHTASGTYSPLAALLRRDGYRVRASRASFSTVALQADSRRKQILVIANALGWRGALQMALGGGRLERIVRLDASALSVAEIGNVASWVQAGGSLLLAADHAPAGAAVRDLAAAFGVQMTDWWAEDAQHHDEVTGNPAFIVFSRDNGLIGDHPLTQGRDGTETVRRVMTFTGQSLRAAPHAVPLLKLSGTAREYPFRRSREAEGRSAAGLAQAVAVQHGKGRVVVLGEAAMITAQIDYRPDGTSVRFGFGRSDTDNLQFTLNIMHWLSGLL